MRELICILLCGVARGHVTGLFESTDSARGAKCLFGR